MSNELRTTKLSTEAGDGYPFINREMISLITPSHLMRQGLPVIVDQINDRYGSLSKPPRETLNDISPVSIDGLTVLTVWEVARHRDEDFAWTALWILRSSGHRLWVQEKKGQECQSLLLKEGSIVVFDTRWWHWTTGAKGFLFVAPMEFEQEPSRLTVTSAFDRAIGYVLTINSLP